ncbi:LuxR C-terminal-related transcriptional regulator [Streptomyces sp. NPDC005970]|uniref:LuxR C-terminal-related transcriptional regulator n=1 Tax=Streptomyces sp. NPDC005970 TaxID=3156723 RepID=UPI0033C6B58E
MWGGGVGWGYGGYPPGDCSISPKTASVHVSNILAKLEVSGRGEAAAVAHRLRLVDSLVDEAAVR